MWVWLLAALVAATVLFLAIVGPAAKFVEAREPLLPVHQDAAPVPVMEEPHERRPVVPREVRARNLSTTAGSAQAQLLGFL
jgi:hypothetical protein